MANCLRRYAGVDHSDASFEELVKASRQPLIYSAALRQVDGIDTLILAEDVDPIGLLPDLAP